MSTILSSCYSVSDGWLSYVSHESTTLTFSVFFFSYLSFPAHPSPSPYFINLSIYLSPYLSSACSMTSIAFLSMSQFLSISLSCHVYFPLPFSFHPLQSHCEGVPVNSRVSSKIQQLLNTLKRPKRPPLREFFVDDFEELLDGKLA